MRDPTFDRRTMRPTRTSIGAVATLAGFAALMCAWTLIGSHPRPTHWFAFALAATSAVTAIAVFRRSPVTALLVAALFLGGIAQLRFTEPDWFSEFRPRPHNLKDLVAGALLAAEGLIAAGALLALVGRRGVVSAITRIGWRRVVVLIALTALTSVPLVRHIALGDGVGYLLRLVLLGAIAAVHIALVAAIVLSPDLVRLWPDEGRAAVLSRRAPLLLAGLATLVAAVLALAAFRGLGLVEDETAYLFQAHTFAAGLLAAPALPVGTEDSFHFYLLVSEPRGWYATTSPGFAAVLALGVLAGVPWLVNPLLGGLAVLLAHRFAERWGDRWIANLVALLMATSPWLLESSASLMTHALSLVLVLGCWVLLTAARDRQAGARPGVAAALAFAAGLLMGWLFLTRALEGVLIGVLSGLWLVWAVRLAGWRAIALYGLGCIVTGSLVFAFNAHFTGDPLLAPLTAYLDALWGPHGNTFGFGPDIGPPGGWGEFDLWRGHSLLEGLINTLEGLRVTTLEMFGWLTGSLVLVWVWAMWSRKGAFARVMAFVAIAVITVHLFYWFDAVFYIGPRYWYAAFVPLAVISAYGARELIARLDAAGVAEANVRVVSTIAILAVFGLAIFTPWRGFEKYAGRAKMGDAIEAAVADPKMGNAVVFLGQRGFQEAAILNDPLLRPGRTVFARDLGPQVNARVLAALPGRFAVYLPIGAGPRSAKPHALR